MKIQFTTSHTDADGKTYHSGWVADWPQPEAEAAISTGYAQLAPEGAYPRKQAAPVFECAAPPGGLAQALSKVADAVEDAVAKQQNQLLDGEMKPTGETITIQGVAGDQLQKTQKKTIFGHIGGK